MASGRKPLPKATLALRGSKYAKSRPGEPTPPEGSPVKPGWLQGVASETWDRLIPILADAGVLSPLYADFLSMFCLAVEDLRKAEAIVKTEGMILKSEKTGSQYLHPAAGLKLNAIERLAKFGREFGMSPSAIRSVAKVESKPKPARLAVSARSRDKERFFP